MILMIGSLGPSLLLFHALNSEWDSKTHNEIGLRSAINPSEQALGRSLNTWLRHVMLFLNARPQGKHLAGFAPWDLSEPSTASALPGLCPVRY